MKCQTIGTYKEAVLFLDILCRLVVLILLTSFVASLIWFALVEKLVSYRQRKRSGNTLPRLNPYDRPDDDDSETVH